MPRKADPKLEKTIITAATRILDKNGIDAVTMREVAKAAGTTTPTLYERFKDRDALLIGVLDRVAYDMLARMQPKNSVEGMCEVFLEYCVDYPNRLDVLHKVWPHTIPTDRKRPTYDLAVKRLREQHGHSGKKADEIASVLMALLLGTAVLMLGAGSKTKFAGKSRRIGLKAVRTICEGFNGR
jgi:AcrR family transcriptional regulator